MGLLKLNFKKMTSTIYTILDVVALGNKIMQLPVIHISYWK